jgi:hypothetical protein
MIRATGASLEYRNGESLNRRLLARAAAGKQTGQEDMVCDNPVACGLCLRDDHLHCSIEQGVAMKRLVATLALSGSTHTLLSQKIPRE